MNIIRKENVLNVYNQASEEQRVVLENVFGKDMFYPKDIKERVKTFEDAVTILGDKHPLVAQFRMIDISFRETDNTLHLFAYTRLAIIAEALNEGWKPKFDDNEVRYYPWFYVYTKDEYERLDEDEKKSFCEHNNSYIIGDGFCAYAYSVSSHVNLYHSSRLAFRTQELSEYCGKQFIDIWSNYLFTK